MIRFVLTLLLFLILVVVLDYIVQRVLSPVNYQVVSSGSSPELPLAVIPDEVKPLSPTPIPESPAPKEIIQESEPPPVIAYRCPSTKTEIEFYDYDKVKHTINFEICDSILHHSIKQRQTLNSRNPHREYVRFDSKNIEPIVASYRENIKNLKLDRAKAAEYIVSSIQNIPYTLVHNYTHREAENPQTYMTRGTPSLQANKLANTFKRLHTEMGAISPLEQPGGCIGVIDYGMVTPVEMFVRKMGDCDSRATALYLVLKKLGYDVIELGSDLYQHALLGLNLPGANHGNIFYTYRGKKYYVWETTAFHPQGTRLGVHKEGTTYMSNWAAWEVALN